MVTIKGKSRTQLNRFANKKLKEIYEKKGITRCEVCGYGWALGFAHKHKRSWYYDQPEELLWDFNETLLLCMKDHDNIEYDKDKSDELFARLRS